MTCKQHPQIPPDALPYELQVAGHKMCGSLPCPMLRHPTHPVIYKWLQNNARGLREVAFYERVYAADAPESHRLLRSFVPEFYGVFRSPQSHDLYLGLSDNLASFRQPNVCDIKLGTVGYRPEADPDKKHREDSKYAWRKELGFMLSGMQLFDPISGTYLKIGKQFCRSLTPDEIYDKAFLTFLGSDPTHRVPLAHAYLVKLMDLQSWFGRFGADSFTFCRTSLLLGHDISVSCSDVVACLIDFTDWDIKCGPTSPIANSCELTTGFARGLSMLVTLLKRAIQ